MKFHGKGREERERRTDGRKKAQKAQKSEALFLRHFGLFVANLAFTFASLAFFAVKS
jgi:hypothetical protein